MVNAAVSLVAGYRSGQDMGLSVVKVQVVEHYFDKRLFQREMYLKKHLGELILYGFSFYIAEHEIKSDTITLKIN
ncbi:hypothetical protein ACFX5U_07585 [Sphingobacterium sp. SG20118]|uniref:hypothetical protein n=1 Tax=Sphingobacterium sp. SG20118 TaxID=3367156 RepID=UPI0037DFC8CB